HLCNLLTVYSVPDSGHERGRIVTMSNTPMAASPLTRAVLEIDEYTSGLGWDQPARLFALVDTARLRSQEPALAAQPGLADEPDTTGLTPVEQDEIPAGKQLDELIARLAYPDPWPGGARPSERHKRRRV